MSCRAATGNQRLTPASAYNPTTYALALANTRQSVVKHVLTEADRIAVGYISPLGDQGGYAVAMNYGTWQGCVVAAPLGPGQILLRQALAPRRVVGISAPRCDGAAAAGGWLGDAERLTRPYDEH